MRAFGTAEAMTEDMDAALISLIDYMLREGKDFMTGVMFQYLPPPRERSHTEFKKDVVWNSMVDQGLLKPAVHRGKGKDKKVPSMRPQHSISDVIKGVLTPSLEGRREVEQKVFPEVANVDAIKRFHGRPDRKENHKIMVDYVQAQLTELNGGRGRGRADAHLQSRIHALENEVRKLQDSEKHLDTLLDKLHHHHPGGRAKDSPVTPKRRRLRTIADEDEHNKAYNVTYAFTRSDIRTRRQAQSISAQRCTRLHQKIMFPHTVDLDIHNCCFVLLRHLVHGLSPSSFPDELLGLLHRISDKRKEVCEAMRLSESQGKLILSKVLNGGGIPETMSDSDTLRGLQRLSRCLRWLAVDVIPDVCSAVGEDL